VAVFNPWGSSWFAASASPYLWSLIKLNPQIGYVAAMPLGVKLHIVNAFIVVGFFPFTRLVHILVVPNPYLWRRPQVVRWNRDPRRGGAVES
jgi:nitrate reductase gamma subunit